MKMQLTNFGAGLTDAAQSDDGALEYLNWTIQPNGVLAVRDGSQHVFLQLPPGSQRVAWVGKHENTYFAVTGKELYSWSGAAWVRVTPLGQNIAVFAYGDVNSFVTAAYIGRDLILCLSPAVGDSCANIPVRVVWDDDRDGSNQGGWTVFPLGLPPVSQAWWSDGLGHDSSMVLESGKTYDDYLWNWGAAWSVEFRNRGRLRRVFGPSLFWQSAVRLDVTTSRPIDAFVAAYAFYYSRAFYNPSGYYDAGFEPWVNQTGDRFPTARMKLAVFRSKANASQLYCVGRLDNNVNLRNHFHDQTTIHGANAGSAVGDLILGSPDPAIDTLLFAPVPFFDSQVDSEGCPPLGFIGDNGTTLLGGGLYDVTWKTGILRSGSFGDQWFGGWSRSFEYRPERVRQAVPGGLDSWPRSFYVDLDTILTGLSGIKGMGFGFTFYRTYCLDGMFDQLGNGGIKKRLISDGVGCSSCASILRFQQSLFWLGSDGFYSSDGVSINPISLNLRKSLTGRTCSFAHADLAGRRLFWVLDTGVWVCSPDFGVEAFNRCFFKWGGPSYLATCFYGDGNVLYSGGSDGWLSKYDSTYSGDLGVGFESTYRTAFASFGDAVADKRQPRVDLVLDNPGSPYSVSIQSYKDGKAGFSSPEIILVETGRGTSESKFIDSRGVVPVKRYLLSNDLRCHSRSIRIAVRGPRVGHQTPTDTLIYRGVVGGKYSFQFSVSRPAGVVAGCLAFFEGSLTPFVVDTVGANTVLFVADPGFSVDHTLTDWSIFGSIPVGVGLRGLVVHYSGSSDDIHGGDAG